MKKKPTDSFVLLLSELASATVSLSVLTSQLGSQGDGKPGPYQVRP